MFGPRMTPSAAPPTRSATACRHCAVTAAERMLAGKTPPAFPRPDRWAALIASITDPGTCVPAAPSRVMTAAPPPALPARHGLAGRWPEDRQDTLGEAAGGAQQRAPRGVPG